MIDVLCLSLSYLIFWNPSFLSFWVWMIWDWFWVWFWMIMQLKCDWNHLQIVVVLTFVNVKTMGTNQYNTYWRNSTLTLIREMDTFNNWTGHLFSLIFISTIQVQLNNSTLEGEPLQYVLSFVWLPLQVPLLVEKYVLL